MHSINDDNPHVIREEDVESIAYDTEHKNINNPNSDSNSNSDIYNSGSVGKNHFSNKDFLKFFRLPLIIIAFLIAIVLTLKFIFFHKINKNINDNKTNKAQNIKPFNNLTIKDDKRFSPSVFDYINKNKNAAAHSNSNKSNEFKTKFNKEMKGLNKIKLNKHLNGNYRNTSLQIPSKMVVFLKASYGKAILNREKGVRAVKSGGKTTYKTYKVRIINLKLTSDRLVIPEGTVVNAYTKYKIFSYNTEVPVIAILSSNYNYRRKIVLKKGDKFFGMVSVKHSLNRLNISFNKIIKTNGVSVNIDAIAMMPDGSGGIKGDAHYHYAGNILTSLAQGVIGAASIFAGGGSGINSSNPYTFQNQIRENVAQNELNQAQNGINSYANSNQNISITLPEGTPIKIIFLKPAYIN